MILKVVLGLKLLSSGDFVYSFGIHGIIFFQVERLRVDDFLQFPGTSPDERVLRRDPLLRQRHRHAPSSQSHSGT